MCLHSVGYMHFMSALFSITSWASHIITTLIVHLPTLLWQTPPEMAFRRKRIWPCELCSQNGDPSVDERRQRLAKLVPRMATAVSSDETTMTTMQQYRRPLTSSTLQHLRVLCLGVRCRQVRTLGRPLKMPLHRLRAQVSRHLHLSYSQMPRGKISVLEITTKRHPHHILSRPSLHVNSTLPVRGSRKSDQLTLPRAANHPVELGNAISPPYPVHGPRPVVLQARSVAVHQAIAMCRTVRSRPFPPIRRPRIAAHKTNHSGPFQSIHQARGVQRRQATP